MLLICGKLLQHSLLMSYKSCAGVFTISTVWKFEIIIIIINIIINLWK
jgi:hypothetical protein